MIISKEIIKYTLSDISHKKTRSGLTILSILIGITAIFIFISFGIGLYNYIETFSSSGSANKITIMAKGTGLDENFILTEADLRAIKSTAGVYEATGTSFKAVEIAQNKIKKYSMLISYDPTKPLVKELSSIKIKYGRDLQKSDDGKVVLGYNYLIADKIFPKAYEPNQKININGIDLQIVGFYDVVGNPQDDAQIYITNDYFKKLFPNQTAGYNWVIAEVDTSKIDTVVSAVENSLRQSRDMKKGKEDFFVQSFEDLLATFTNVLKGVAGFIILIALISVLVSAINTSNTMITSVLERRKEIGVMKSVGARNSEVLKIFIFESGFLGFVAGILGVLLGYIISQSISTVINSTGWSFLAPAYPISLFLGCILFATLTGAISGLAPAINASKVSPVQALRYE